MGGLGGGVPAGNQELVTSRDPGGASKAYGQVGMVECWDTVCGCDRETGVPGRDGNGDLSLSFPSLCLPSLWDYSTLSFYFAFNDKL